MITEHAILQALKNNELVYYYQPKVSFITGKVVGAEALIRWIKADGSIIPPNDFIPIAEKSWLIKEITLSMLDKLIRDLVIILDIKPIAISFNVSAQDLADTLLVDKTAKVLKQLSIDPKFIEVELTETSAIIASDTIKENISKLCDAGIRISMDDFGTGFASMEVFSQWPFSGLKLDMSLIEQMLDSPKHLSIIQNSIRIGHELGIDIIAEGIESEEQYQLLLESGCTKSQGFWISKPLPLDEFIDFIAEDLRFSGLPIGLLHMSLLDHIQWRKKLISLIMKYSASQNKAGIIAQLPELSHWDCKLGKWINGLGKEHHQHDEIEALDKAHQHLHNTANRLVDMVIAEKTKKDYFPFVQELSDHSTEVIKLLHHLEAKGLMEMHQHHQKWLEHPFH
ncbi:MAG: hypothetical protein methR_P0794 [Methyloprofundus sp.]|nr:MAG: hypothetical protein methR_P0794 [Methyloprofundus sp.]